MHDPTLGGEFSFGLLYLGILISDAQYPERVSGSMPEDFLYKHKFRFLVSQTDDDKEGEKDSAFQRYHGCKINRYICQDMIYLIILWMKVIKSSDTEIESFEESIVPTSE